MIPFGEHPVDAELRIALLETADELIRLTGADLCKWNGSIGVHRMLDAEGERAALGIAHWSGTISLRDDVLSALRDLWNRSPREWSDEDRGQHRPGVLTVAHELVHYLVPAGQRYARGAPVYREFPGRALEEGATELAGRKHAGAFAAAEVRSPGVTDARAATSYPQFVPATEAIVQYLSELRSESEESVLNALVRENVPGKFQRLSQMVLEARGTWAQIPPTERDAASARVINAVWSVYQANSGWASPRPVDRPTQAPDVRSWIMGRQVIAAAERARLQAVAQYGPDRPMPTWQVAAAQYEVDLARDVVNSTRSSRHPDVRAAAGAWMQRAHQRKNNAWQEVEREQVGQGLEPTDPSASGGRAPSNPSVPLPEVAAVPGLVEPPRPVPRRRPPRPGVRRHPGPPDRGRDR